MLLLLFDKGDFEQAKFVINQNKSVSTVVFMPLHKRMPKQSGKSASGTSDKAHTMSYDAYQKALERRKKSKKSTSKSTVKSGKKSGKSGVKKPKPVATKSVVKTPVSAPVPQVKAPTMLHQEKPKAVAVKTIPKKIVAAKKAPKVVKVADTKKAKKTSSLTQKEKIILAKTLAQSSLAKTIADKKLADKKALEQKAVEKTKEDKIPEKEDVKTEEIKAAKIAEQEKIESSDAKTEKKVEEQQEIVPTVQAETVEKIESDDHDDESDSSNASDDDEDDIDIGIDFDNVIFVGRDDMAKREIEGSIKKEFAICWKPPFGIAKTAVCELLILIGIDGKALKIDVKKPSISRAYDMSARAAASQVHYPKEVCGKEITIKLGES